LLLIPKKADKFATTQLAIDEVSALMNLIDSSIDFFTDSPKTG
jgi:hypothetical protein